MKKWGLLLLLLLGLDLLTKVWALHSIPFYQGGAYPFGGIGVFSWGFITCSFNTIFNTGVAWGVFAGHAGLLFALRVAIILGIVFFTQKRFPVWLVLTGAVGV